MPLGGFCDWRRTRASAFCFSPSLRAADLPKVTFHIHYYLHDDDDDGDGDGDDDDDDDGGDDDDDDVRA